MHLAVEICAKLANSTMANSSHITAAYCILEIDVFVSFSCRPKIRMSLNSAIPIEQQLLEAVRILAPEKQQAVLDFAEFLRNRQMPEPNANSGKSLTPERFNDGKVNLAERGISTEQAAELRS